MTLVESVEDLAQTTVECVEDEEKMPVECVEEMVPLVLAVMVFLALEKPMMSVESAEALVPLALAVTEFHGLVRLWILALCVVATMPASSARMLTNVEFATETVPRVPVVMVFQTLARPSMLVANAAETACPV